ncbi:uncharacterized protein BDW47DRAFT_99357 [Aspergillus candidus]|uniref:Uncharacterized protein n=1 Tax=Aspergillus candidus TaxID=41067 RepID=A0A2I2FLT5_ASPCN|nr:hypothetical protein BDW47DRAFT_99357 [Aspergillus candidus]PLB41595.1 hypothetical protein BDW47DRAFT_99357 [Aspergillus candidus]
MSIAFALHLMSLHGGSSGWITAVASLNSERNNHTCRRSIHWQWAEDPRYLE